jgi:hypothetical protein
MSLTRKRRGKAFRKTKRTSKFQIPNRYISLGVVIFCLFVLGGGIYNILESPQTIVQVRGGGFSSIHYLMSDQTVTEGYVIMLANTATFAGFYMTYRSTQVTYNRTSANRWLIVGIALIVLGVGGNYLFIQVKRSLL